MALSNEELGKLIAETAAQIDFRDVFTEKAMQASERLQEDDIPRMKAFFHESPPEPGDAQTSIYSGGRILGVWMSACQDAIFEICYHSREKAIRFLYDIGFGIYDWTQWKALHVLIRFAEEGLKSDQFLRDIAKGMDHFRYETTEAVIDFMADYPLEMPEEMVASLEEHGHPLELARAFRLSKPYLAKKYAEEVLKGSSVEKVVHEGFPSIEELLDLSFVLAGNYEMDELVGKCLLAGIKELDYPSSLNFIIRVASKRPEILREHADRIRAIVSGDSPFDDDFREAPSDWDRIHAMVALTYIFPEDVTLRWELRARSVLEQDPEKKRQLEAFLDRK